MNTQIKNYFSKLLLTVATALSILTGMAAAQEQQQPDNYEAKREQFAAQIKRQTAQAESLAAKRKAAERPAAVSLANSDTFQNGKDFTLAMFDADGLDQYDEALQYTILDLVYLIDRLDGQPEAAQLQKTLRAVVRGTSSGALVKQDIERISNAYLAHQKPDQKWYFSAGRASMNLMIAAIAGEDADIKKGLTELQSLIKAAPKTTAKEILNPMGALAKYIAQTAYTDEDYTAIYEGVGSIIDAATA